MLNIDGYSVEAGPGESLLDLISRLPIPAEKLSERPLAAKIAGEVFTLNYVPLRQKDAQGERPSMRQAMAATGRGFREILEHYYPGTKVEELANFVS